MGLVFRQLSPPKLFTPRVCGAPEIVRNGGNIHCSVELKIYIYTAAIVINIMFELK